MADLILKCWEKRQWFLCAVLTNAGYVVTYGLKGNAPKFSRNARNAGH